METSVQIIADSSCDLPQALVDRYQIGIVPLAVHFGPETYGDGELDPATFWEKAAGPHPPKTSQPPVGRFEAFFQSAVEQGRRALCLTITSKHSGTYNAAELAAQRFGEDVAVFDSLSLSLGLGWQVLEAAKAAQAGQPIERILSMLRDFRRRVRFFVVLDTLENLRRGGRADAFIGVLDRMTRMLNIKIILNVVDGEIHLLGAARSFQGGIRRVVRAVDDMAPLQQLGIMHTRNLERAEALAERFSRLVNVDRDEMLIQETGAALACHAGRSALGVAAVMAASEGASR